MLRLCPMRFQLESKYSVHLFKDVIPDNKKASNTCGLYVVEVLSRKELNSVIFVLF